MPTFCKEKHLKTKNLDVVEAQAFNYHNLHANSKYIIISNFEQTISKALYRDFGAFRTHLFENIVQNNAGTDKQALLRLTKKHHKTHAHTVNSTKQTQFIF